MILTEGANPKSKNIDIMSAAEIVDLINGEDKKVATAIAKVKPAIARAIDKIVAGMQKGGRMAYFGAGTSGRLGVLDASEMPPTFGADPTLIQGFIAGGNRALRHAVEHAEDNAELAKKDIKAFAPTPYDTVVGLSVSGMPAYVCTALAQARKKGALTVAISCNPAAKIKEFADIFINPLVGPEVLTGSSRMKAGTAQKMILNMLSTGTMIRLGKTYHNYMIDMHVTNAKLKARAIRMIREITGVSEDEAKKALSAAENNVKVACVMAKTKCTVQVAQKKLEKNHQFLRKVIK